jgi:hypothetical protein
MPVKHQKPNFARTWFAFQALGAIAIAIISQGIAAIAIFRYQIDDFYLICLLSGSSYLCGNIIQGYGQWSILKQVVDRLDWKWIYSHTIGIPIQVMTLIMVHIGLAMGTWDDHGTIVLLLAGVGGIGGAVSGLAIGDKQQVLLQKHLPEKSLWADWHHDRLLAGALGGMSSAIMTIGLLIFSGWDRVSAIVYIPLLFAGIFITYQVLYGIVIGDALTDLFKRTKLLR